MKKTAPIALNILIACVFYNCNDKPRSQLFIDSKTKDYVVFQSGSYWIYEEKNTLFVDTISLFLNESSMEYWEGFSANEFELISLYLKWASERENIKGDRSTFISIIAKIKSNRNVGICEEQYPWFLFPNIVFFPFDTVGEIQVIWDSIKYENFYDSISVKGRTYYDVMEISSSSPAHPKKQKSIWWAKNIGRIKWENFGGEVWQLTNYHVLQ